MTPQPKYTTIFFHSDFPTRKFFWEKVKISSIADKPTLVRLLSWIKIAFSDYQANLISLRDLEDFFELLHFDVVLQKIGDSIRIDPFTKQGYVEELIKLSDLTDSIVRYGFNDHNQEFTKIMLDRFSGEIQDLESSDKER